LLTNETTANTHVLIIDDDANVLQAITFVLEDAGYQHVIAVPGWTEAEVCLAHNRQIGLILLDIQMPGVNGREALLRLRQTWPQIAVAMLTGTNDLEIAVECMKRGACDYMVKPVTEQRLLECVRSIILLDQLPGDNAWTTTEKLQVLTQWMQDLIQGIPNKEGQSLLLKELHQYVVEQKGYCDSNLTLDSLAKRLKTNVRTLGEIIDKCYQIPFRTFINQLRLAEFFALSRNPDYAHYSLEGLAKEVGFVRLATFYTAFKNVTGTTPAGWFRQQRH